jgi:hypothetical protein
MSSNELPITQNAEQVPKAHFSFSNALYDDCNLQKKYQESTSQFKWITDNVKESNDACYVNQSPFMHKQFKSIPFNKIDIESDLRNRNRPLSRCPEARFDPTKLENCKDCQECNLGLPCGCNHCRQTKHENELKDCSNNGLVPEYTRINKPCNIFSGITINRFNPLCEDLTSLDKIHSNSYIGTNTRNLIKDAFKVQHPN